MQPTNKPRPLSPVATPKVSVVIPSFNCAEYIADTIDSILAQTLMDIEIIVVDDGSTDHTRQVIDRYSAVPNLRYVYQDNRGLPGARNAGVRVSSGLYLAFVDADDALRPDALASLYAALDGSQASWCVMDILKVRSGTQEIQRSAIPAGDLFYGILRDDFIRRAMFFRREDFIAVGMYDETMKNREDWDINIRMLESRRSFVYIPEPLYFYRWREGSITTGPSEKMLDYTRALLRKHHKRLADSGDIQAARIYAANMWDLARRYFYQKRNFRKASACVWESLAYDRNPKRLFHPLVYQFKGSWLRRSGRPA